MPVDLALEFSELILSFWMSLRYQDANWCWCHCCEISCTITLGGRVILIPN
jgi:hypothetical protein